MSTEPLLTERDMAAASLLLGQAADEPAYIARLTDEELRAM